MATCIEDECAAPVKSRGLCPRCYQRVKYQGRLDDYPATMVRRGATLDERLRHHGWTVTERDCWEWRGSRNPAGYGQLAIGSTRPHLAPRVAYEAWVRPLEAGEVVCHRCDNPPCVNPAHLFIGDRGVNNRDAASKLRTANGELRPHRLTDAQVDEIRAAYAAGGVLYRELAERYEVSKSLIGFIVRGQRRARPTNWR